MIKLLYQKGNFYPFIFCDICQEPITNVRDAAIVHKIRPDTASLFTDGTLLDILFTHKGDCHDRAEKQIGGIFVAGWEELAVELHYLLGNSHLSLEYLQELAELEAEGGLLTAYHQH